MFSAPAASFDHLVGAGKQRRRHFEAKRLGSFEINGHLELDWQLYRQVRRLCTGCIEAEEIRDIILVGHSYGGMVITGLADRMADRIKALVYLDAFVPGDGESLMALLHKAVEPAVAAQFIVGFRGAALEKTCGMTHPLTAEMLGVSPANREWVNRRCVPQALATFEMPRSRR